MVAAVTSAQVEQRQWPIEESTWRLEFVGVSGTRSWVGGMDEKMLVNENDRNIRTK